MTLTQRMNLTAFIGCGFALLHMENTHQTTDYWYPLIQMLCILNAFLFMFGGNNNENKKP